MTQERPTSLRILQTNKKKSLSPVIYVFVGFILGIIFSLIVFFVLFQAQSNDSVQATEQTEQYSTPSASSQNTVESVSSVIEQVQHENTESEEDSNFAQPQGTDLNKFFQHSTTATPDPAHRSSPFANELNGNKPVPPATPKPIQQKNAATTAPEKTKKVVETEPSKTTIPKAAESETEAPQASVQINVTQRPFTVNELK
ncbi:hypothetical protein [Acinetobacter haemolyticus]|uniref:hypothetical protein n=1 Tax=Acinetobacter haemolyticus TaxID=29430 RepID=UPI000D69DB3F|nr:hypothetical protein [Acinetobacter haemolyticus]